MLLFNTMKDRTIVFCVSWAILTQSRIGPSVFVEVFCVTIYLSWYTADLRRISAPPRKTLLGFELFGFSLSEG